MADHYQKFNSTINRRDQQNEGDMSEPVSRENWLCRDGKLQVPKGTERAITTVLSGKPRWMGRYYTVETGISSPKSFIYTEDGVLWVMNSLAQTATSILSNLNTNAYPVHQLFKTQNQTKLFLVDGENLFRYDGNNDNNFELLNITDTNGATLDPIDVIEHKDRLCMISETNLYISKNLEPENFADATDSLVIIVGSGRGRNLALGKLEDRLFILTTEGIFVLEGDVISALAQTFEVRLVDERKIIAGRSVANVEKALVFLADDYEIWSFDGSDSELLTYKFKLKDTITKVKEVLKKTVATYFNNYFMISFAEEGEIEPNLELWWDAFENKVDIVRGRNVSCYLDVDSAQENDFLQTGRSDVNRIMDCERGYNFDGAVIVTRLRTRDITPKKGHNVRFLAFYPEINPTANLNITIQYLLDGRSSQPSGSAPWWEQSLRGEVVNIGIGPAVVSNQSNFTDRVRPKINYARGESIAFSITMNTLNVRADFVGMGIDFIARSKSKGKLVGA